MLLINCDIGERGISHPIDDELMDYIDIANIACGGHAGDKESVAYYLELSYKKNVKITAHISYPDKANFGRKVIQIDTDDLLKSFDNQLKMFDDKVKSIKPHGALYNQLSIDDNLANLFVSWCKRNDIKELLVNPFGVLNNIALESDIAVIAESFIERGYILDKYNNPMLMPRGQQGAEIKDINKALNQYLELRDSYISIKDTKIGFESKTACIHSDSSIALELARKISQIKD